MFCTQAEEGEVVPEELASLITRKNSGAPTTGAEMSSTKKNEEDSGALVRERELRLRVTKEKEELSTVVDGLKNKITELDRRHADARRAYEQEKRVSICFSFLCTCIDLILYCVCMYTGW